MTPCCYSNIFWHEPMPLARSSRQQTYGRSDVITLTPSGQSSKLQNENKVNMEPSNHEWVHAHGCGIQCQLPLKGAKISPGQTGPEDRPQFHTVKVAVPPAPCCSARHLCCETGARLHRKGVLHPLRALLASTSHKPV
ncbi:hypothetical protein AAFF_G00130440 [Aldrovandia affinis]|uniref:Uncharacterized protein n=1 Tax=Aldrovandia affinis TaxID=143900 RepID=A0AAD7W9F0_9TELE|nr:hypothetical protein AAFF_G00130440 [Aldrovandia affinis]